MICIMCVFCSAVVANENVKEVRPLTLTPIGNCGSESLRAALFLLNREEQLDMVALLLEEKPTHTMLEVKQAAEAMGLFASAVKFRVPTAAPVGTPMIVPVARERPQRNHYVVLVHHGEGKATVIDFPRPAFKVNLKSSPSPWDGSALLLASTSEETRSWRTAPRSTLWDFRALIAVVSTSVAIVGVWVFGRRRFASVFKPNKDDSTRRQKNWGFTLIDLLVTMGVFLLLVGLALPAVQFARQAAQKANCSNNLRQLALGLSQYVDNGGFYPVSRRQREHGSLATPKLPKHYSVLAAILPFLDQRELYEAINFDQPQNFGFHYLSAPENRTAFETRVLLFLCPSDSLPGAGTGNNYRANTGGDANSVTGPFPSGRYVRPSEVRDGLSRTAGLSERRVGSWGARFLPQYDVMFFYDSHLAFHPTPTIEEWLAACRYRPSDAVIFTESGRSWFIDGSGFTTYNHVAPPNSVVVDCIRLMGGPKLIGTLPARSWHGDAVNVGFLDGSVRSVGSSVSSEVWRAIGTIAGGEADADL